jgi:ethanolamine ammonia-lyase small subunit
MNADCWTNLRDFTAARIALGRAGGSLPTDEVLRFSLDHALARDAVHTDLDFDRLVQAIRRNAVCVTTKVSDRTEYVKRPDLGRLLSDESREALAKMNSGDGFDLSIVIADGLSATAVQLHAAALLELLIPKLENARLSLAPIVLARFGRVALQDEIGALLNARCSVMLIGERPGLGAPDSMGAYLVFKPRIGNTDANRNCVSNIRPSGLPLESAASTLEYLITQSLARQISGVQLKDERALECGVGTSHTSTIQDQRGRGVHAT